MKNKRIVLLDTLRGVSMLYVMFYHIMYDLRFIYSQATPAFITPGNAFFEILHGIFLTILFSVSGVCSTLSRNSLKRGALLYIAGYLITIGTELFMPSELIVFGVLSCFGACMVMTALAEPLIKKAGDKSVYFSAVFLLLAFVFRDMAYGRIDLVFTRIDIPVLPFRWLYPLGLRGADFASSDYFPLIPFLFLFLAGRCAAKQVTELAQKAEMKPGVVEFIGKHSLIFYLAHQPLILLVLEIIFMSGGLS